MEAQSDVQSEKSLQYGQLDWVGMSQIQTAVIIESQDRLNLSLPALLDLGVDLSENNRGIHMSRLYRLHQEIILNQTLTSERLSNLAEKSLLSQAGLSQKFSARLKMFWPKKTMSLKSQMAGFRNYPIEIIFEKDLLSENVWLQFEVLYSSTCPQSTGLAIEVFNRQAFDLEKAITHLPATPHAQRSRAVVRVQLNQLNQNVIDQLIEMTEKTLGTPVQTTVKKVDEMQFAMLNAENLMFCEDAARKISQTLSSEKMLKGYSIFCEHQESLHPHNATSLKKANYSEPLRIQFG
jgi:GTP cyclohydrolase IB